MAGIYIHIPYCKQKCVYCNFHFSTNLEKMNVMVEAILKEIEIRKNYINAEKVESIYFGGGTPSLLSINDIDNILKKIHKTYNVIPFPEITLEINPDDINKSKILNWKNIGINRLSVGIQTLDEKSLIWLNRSHHKEQSLLALELISTSFENYSIDIIYGIPTQNHQEFENTIHILNQYKIPHISGYGLTVEKNTKLFSDIKKKLIQDVDQDFQVEQYEILINFLSNKNYEQYEISNFSLPNFKSKHNSNYWNQINYLGIGPSAHSYNGFSRQWNISNNALYIQNIHSQNNYFETEILTDTQIYNEYLMTSLRTIEGTSIEKINNNFNEKIVFNFHNTLKKYFESPLILIKNNRIYLTEKGKLFADKIASDFFVIDIV